MSEISRQDARRTSRVLFLYPGQSRLGRLPGVADKSVPVDFFYGYFAARDAGYPVAIGDTRKDPQGALANLHLKWEILRNRLTNFGLTRQRVAAVRDQMAECEIAISFTDFFSLSMGLAARSLPRRPLLLGGFHGLTDLVDRSHPLYRPFYERAIHRAVHALDHLFFFGEVDRLEAIRRYGLPETKTSLFRFGVDTEFWSPEHPGPSADGPHVLAVGSDPQRDFATLAAAPTTLPVRILTRLRVPVPPERTNVTLLQGSLYASAISDQQLREMYCQALAVAVPLKDVNQPSGYSVTLQAMACGRPVVLSKIRGLWDPHLLRSGDNCLLVPPGDPQAMAEALEALRTDPELSARLGASALDTARREFSLRRMDRDVVSLLDSVAG